jgi:polyphosphate kinase 2 (PPK2 family)
MYRIDPHQEYNGVQLPRKVFTTDRTHLCNRLAGGMAMKDKNSKKALGLDHNGTLHVEDEHKNHVHSSGNTKVNCIGKDCKYAKELRKLQIELVKWQEWIREK